MNRRPMDVSDDERVVVYTIRAAARGWRRRTNLDLPQDRRDRRDLRMAVDRMVSALIRGERITYERTEG